MNLLEMAMKEVAERKQWHVGEKVVLATANGTEKAYLYNDDCFIRLYVQRNGQVSPGFNVAWLDMGIGEWVAAHEATEENYQAWADRIKEPKPDEDRLLQWARKAEEKYPKLKYRPYKAAELVRRGHVTHKGGSRFEVKSQSSDRVYQVDTEKRSCTCPDWRGVDMRHSAPWVLGEKMCKHRLACLMWVKMKEVERAETPATSPKQAHSITPQRIAQLLQLQEDAWNNGCPVLLI